MKFIVVAPNISSKGLASSYRISLIIEFLLKKGHEITLFTAVHPIKPELEKYENLNVHYIRNNRDNNYFYKVISKLFSVPDPMIFWCLKVCSRILKNRKTYREFDYSFYSSPPHSLHVIGLLLKTLLKVPFISDFRDDWMGSHRLSHLTIVHKYLSSKIEAKVVNQSRAVFNAIPIVSKDLKLKYPKYSHKIFTATNGFDNAFKERLLDTSFGEKYNQNTIVYCGGGYKGFINEKFNNLASGLIALGLDSKWKIVSAGPGIEVDESNKGVWKHHGLVSPQKVEELIVNASVHLSILPEGDLINSRTIPLKMYSQVITQGSILFIGNKGVTNDVFKDLPGIFFLGYNAWENLSDFIKMNEEKLEEKHLRNVDKFNFQNIMNDYISIINNLENPK
tara:strand:- start:615738 stop:616916 length:1179 start_codon:yes stop_codon:yes gene_type:complete